MGSQAISPSVEKPAFLIRIAPAWEHIEPLRSYVDVWVKTRAVSGCAERAGPIVQELLENAVKYGAPKADVELAIWVLRAGQAVDVQVSNNAHPSRLTILEREVQRNRATEPHEAFARALERLQRLPEGSSMLGLSRIALDSVLDVEIGVDSVVMTAHVVAGVQFGARASAKPDSGKFARPDGPTAAARHSSGARRLDPTATSSSQTRPAAGGVQPASPTAHHDMPTVRVPLGRK